MNNSTQHIVRSGNMPDSGMGGEIGNLGITFKLPLRREVNVTTALMVTSKPESFVVVRAVINTGTNLFHLKGTVRVCKSQIAIEVVE